MDDAIHTAAVHDDDWEAALVAKAKGETVEESEEEEEERPVRKLPTARAALDSVRDIVGIALSASDARLLDAATTLQNLLEGHCIRQATAAKQTSMMDFFGR